VPVPDAVSCGRIPIFHEKHTKNDMAKLISAPLASSYSAARRCPAMARERKEGGGKKKKGGKREAGPCGRFPFCPRPFTGAAACQAVLRAEGGRGEGGGKKKEGMEW